MADRPRDRDSNADVGDYPGTARWVKVFGLIAIVLVRLFVILMLASGGGHGPGRHLS